MSKIVVVADSTCDLSKELVEKFDIKIIPLHVTFPGEDKDYHDGVDIFSEQVYKFAEEKKVLPKTGAVNVGEFVEFFQKEVDEGNEVIYISIGTGLSSSYNNAVLAASQIENGKIACVDGQNLSTGTGLLVVKAAKLRDEGLSLTQIKEEIEKRVPLVSAKFCIDRLDYLYKGGRCSGMTKLFAHSLKIHPVAKIINNKLVVYKKPHGKYKNAVDVQIEEFKKDYEENNIDLSCVFITHSGRIDGFDQYIYDELIKYVDKENLHITEAGCTVCSHCGPKTIGILYILNK